jgi:hypothetical protein
MKNVATCFAALLFASYAFAQTFASVSGTVTDPSGANVVGATITATNVATGANTVVTTNEAGIYGFGGLQPGNYTFTAEHPGFRKSTINNVTLEVSAVLTVNLKLELGQTTETVEVEASATQVNASNATVGDVVGERKILDLPLVGRSAYGLIGVEAGVVINGAEGVNINGAQTGAVNYTTDGINTQDNLLNGAFNTNVSNTVSIDRVEEFRIVTSPADAEYGRGSAQVQMVTRGGSNKFAGSAWEEMRNTDLNANDWFNNQKGTNPNGTLIAPRNVLVRNQFGLRFGGPVKKNKTFFNGIWEGDHQNQRLAENSVVFTPSALQGIFRYFPGATNANITSGIPTVNASGQPLQPASATGSLQTVSVFGKDPNRMVPDPTGTVTRYLGLEPAPNNYLVGDGLNTAGFNWAVPVIDDFGLYEGRIDHNFNDKQRIYVTLNHQAYTSTNVANAQPVPAAPIGLAPTETTQYSVHYTNAISATMLNEATFGVFRPRVIVWEDIDPNGGAPGAAGQKLLPTANGSPFYPGFASAITNPLVSPGGPTGTGSSNRISQNWEYADNQTWIKGKHTLKGGVDIRFIQNAGYDTGGVTPTTTGGAGSVPVVGISTLSGIGSNATAAQNLLTDLAGDFASITEALNAPGGSSNSGFLPGLSRYSDLHTHEYSFYFKDDWKVRPNLTLNLGVRYEFYGVPRDYDGREVGLVGGSAAVFGPSGTNLSSEFQPGLANGLGLTQLQLEGPKTSLPNGQLYKNEYNDWAPFLGFAWSLPGEGSWKWLSGGKDQTVIRGGYGISYQRDSLYLTHQITSFEPNGLTTSPIESLTGSVLDFANVTLPIPTTAVPLATTPLTGPRNAALWAFDSGLKAPRIQNYNFSIQRVINASTTFTASFVGSAASRLIRTFDVNELNILNNGFLQAFDVVQQGGDSPLIDALAAPFGGSAGVRALSFFQTYVANNNPGGLALLLNNSYPLTGVGGSLVSGAKLPSNFFAVNPAFPDAFLATNSGHSTYNSMQLLINRRLRKGFTIQGSYVLSKALGDNSAGDNADFLDDYRTLTNFGLDKQVLAFNHKNVYKINGIYELPFGPGKPFANGTNGIMSRLVGGWQLGAIFTYESGAPLSITANQNGLGGYTTSLQTLTATQVAPIASGVQEVGNGVVFFPGAGGQPGYTQVADPSIAQIAPAVGALSTMKAITNSSGQIAYVNPLPGYLGSLAINSLTGPRFFDIDLNLIKNIRITERFVAQLRATAQNFTNTASFSAPTANIDSATFGHITSDVEGPRIIVLQLRLNF